MKKKKVLIVTESVSYGGNNIVAMNIEKHLDKEKFECTYCVRRDTVGAFEEEVLSRGVRVIHVPDSKLSYYSSYKFYYNLMKKEHFDIVHCHLPFFSGIVLLAAKKCGVDKRIAHAHFSQPYTDTAIYSKRKQLVATIYRKVMRLFLKKYCNVKIACEKDAGEFLFGITEFQNKGIIVNNGIEVDKFSFSYNSREKIRTEFNISDETVILGHIGQMYSVKNQSFIIDVFAKFLETCQNSVLMLVGDGVDREMLVEKAAFLNISDKVIFTGNRSDSNMLYQAMDCFVFPSIHEGFPMTLIEAQASKLPCVVSNNVSSNCKINDNFYFCSLDDSSEIWREKIFELIQLNRENTDISKVINSFDIESVTGKFEKLYLS